MAQKADAPSQDSAGVAATTASAGRRGKVGADKKQQAVAPENTRRDANHYDWVRENLEAVVVAFILALIIRHFAVEAFEIPTGSMAPTLYGIHAWSQCPNCDTPFNIGLPSDSGTGDLSVRYQRVTVYRGEHPESGIPHVEAQAPWSDEPFRPGVTRFRLPGADPGDTWTGRPEDFHEEDVIVAATRSHGRGLPNILMLCPLCDYTFQDVLTESNRSGGHKILVNKFSYRFGTPRRLDVIVFKKDEEHNYIKRLLGLPGEVVSLRGGDLYVKTPAEEALRIVRKTDEPYAREALWFPISDADVAEKGYNPVPAWREVFERGSGLDSKVASKWWTWIEAEKRWSVNNLGPDQPPEDEPERVAILRYNRDCVNYYSYNLLREPITESMLRNPIDLPVAEQVGDKRVRCSILPSRESAGRGWVGGEVRDGEFVFQFRLPVGELRDGEKAVLLRLPVDGDRLYPSPNRSPLAAHAGARAEASVSLPLGESTEVTFENADDRVRVLVGGDVVLELDYRSGSPALDSAADHDLLLLAANVTANFDHLKVDRDVYYTIPGVESQPRILDSRGATHHVGSRADGGRDEYFPCGDNSPSSLDGRYWGSFPRSNLMGRALVIFWPVWNQRLQLGFIR